MNYFTLGHRLPHFLSAPLFGDRKKYGLQVQPEDPCWKEWESTYLDFYYSNQKQSIGRLINNAGYRVMRRFDLSGKMILEVGPGDINHINQWRGKPAHYVIGDIQQEMLNRSSKRLASGGISHEAHLLSRDLSKLPFNDEQFDFIVTFYALEHLYSLETHLLEIRRVLKTGGSLIGAIPCEGGLAWGMGRYMTSRRWLLRNTTINPDKIICWEHVNFSEDILNSMDRLFDQVDLTFWPWLVPSIDLNLVVQFVYKKN